MMNRQLALTAVGLVALVGGMIYLVSEQGERYRRSHSDQADAGARDSAVGRDPASSPPPAAPAASAPSASDSMELIRRAADKLHAATQAIDETGQKSLALSVEEEMAYGRQVHELIVNRHKVYPPAEPLERVRSLAAPIIRSVSRPQITYTLTVLENEEVNAFSHLGGYVYIHKGLLDMVQTDDELQFVLAHEIGHVDLGHCVKQLTYTVRAAAIADQLGKPGEIGVQAVQAAYQTIALGYSEDKEFESDLYAYRALLALGVDHEQALSFPRRFRDYLEKNGAERPRPDPNTPWEAGVHVIEDHLRTHPPARQRVERLEKLGAKR